MTVKKSVVIGLKDIRQIQIECQCGAAFSYNPDKEIRLPEYCPQCQTRWRDDFMNSLDQQIVEGFMSAIRKAREQQQANARVKINLVLEETGAVEKNADG